MYFLVILFLLLLYPITFFIFKVFRSYLHFKSEVSNFVQYGSFVKIKGTNYFKTKKINPTNKKTILIIGDSMSLGIGSDSQYLTYINPQEYNLEVIGKIGAKAIDVLNMVKRLKKKYFAVLLFVGPNDVVSMNPRFLVDIRKVFRRLRKHSSKIVWTVGDVEVTPIIPSYLKRIFGNFGKFLKEKSIIIAQEYQVKVFHIMRNHTQDYFYKNPEEYFAKDGFHPNKKGYRLIFRGIFNNLI